MSVISKGSPGSRALESGRKNEVEIFSRTHTATKPIKKKILNEDKYLHGIGKIIERDFYPDLEKLRAQNEYLDALSENNVEKLRELYSKYSSGRPCTERYASPATFETPLHNNSNETVEKDAPGTDNIDKYSANFSVSNKEDDKPIKGHSLDQYLAVHTSEDNESFKEIQQDSINKHKLKHKWLYKSEEEYNTNKRLMLPSIEEQAAGLERDLTVDTWNYQNRNHCMYVPEGVELSEEEKLDIIRKKQEIVHENTRLSRNPFNEQHNMATIHELALTQAKNKEGKIGVDGKIMTCQTPTVGGYSFIKTPSPAPGVNETPLMTWGEIEGTPFRLDGSDTPLRSSGPSFKMPEIPKREKLAMALADKASEKYRDRKRKAIEAAKSNLAALSPSFRHLSSLDKLNEMSPAAQRLASVTLGSVSDKALRNSYSPSPSRRTPHLQSPTPRKTIRRSTPNITLTDNLLELPKRPKASDFF